MGRRPLYWKLYLAFLGVLLAIVLLSGGVVALFSRSFAMVRAGPRVAVHLSRSLPTPDDLTKLQSEVEAASFDLSLDVTVIDLDGKELAHAGQHIDSPPPEQLARLRAAPTWATPSLVSAPLRRQTEQSAARAAEERKRAIDAEHPQVNLAPLTAPPLPFPGSPAERGQLPRKGGGDWPPMPWEADPSLREPPLGIVLVRVPIAADPPPIWGVRSLALIGVLLLSAALLYPLSRSITRPLEKLTGAAEAFGKGELSRRSGIEAGDEVGRLARSFDEMASRIERARRAEKELLANVSHELRTPLARLTVAIELINPPAGPEGDQMRRRLAGLSEEITELTNLVADVLTQSRLELAELPLTKKQVRVKALLERSRDRALSLVQQPVEIDSPDDLLVIADESLLKRVLDNLIDNARKYATSADGDTIVHLKARGENDQLVLSVSDRGAGFPLEDLTHIFEAFFRGQNAGGRSGGYGLGLALAKRVAEAHHGTITASNLPTGGAQIELRIPGLAT